MILHANDYVYEAQFTINDSLFRHDDCNKDQQEEKTMYIVHRESTW